MQSDMKVIGLLGGMSWTSSAEYYRIINELVAEKLGGLHSARLILYSFDFDGVQHAQHEGRWEDTAVLFTRVGNALKQAGADFMLICSNTGNIVADSVAEKCDLPLLHIAEVVGDAIKACNLTKIGLLGTRFTMEGQLYRKILEERFGIEVMIPDEEGRATIHRIIYDELCQEKIIDSSLHEAVKVINELIARGAEGIILGCTELPLLIKPSDVSVPLFDSTRIHAEAAVKLALGE